MSTTAEASFDLSRLDPVWVKVRDAAKQLVEREPLMASLAHAVVLHHDSFEDALGYRLAQKLTSPEMSELLLREIAAEAFSDSNEIVDAARTDVVAVFDRDPACHSYLQPILYFKGFQALQAYRIAHSLWRRGRNDLAYFIQMRTSEVFGVDIHPVRKDRKGHHDRPRAQHRYRRDRSRR